MQDTRPAFNTRKCARLGHGFLRNVDGPLQHGVCSRLNHQLVKVVIQHNDLDQYSKILSQVQIRSESLVSIAAITF